MGFEWENEWVVLLWELFIGLNQWEPLGTLLAEESLGKAGF